MAEPNRPTIAVDLEDLRTVLWICRQHAGDNPNLGGSLTRLEARIWGQGRKVLDVEFSERAVARDFMDSVLGERG